MCDMGFTRLKIRMSAGLCLSWRLIENPLPCFFYLLGAVGFPWLMVPPLSLNTEEWHLQVSVCFCLRSHISFSDFFKDPFDYTECVLSHFSRVWLFANPWIAAHQAPLSADRGSLQPRDWTGVSCISCTGRIFFTTSTSWEAPCLMGKVWTIWWVWARHIPTIPWPESSNEPMHHLQKLFCVPLWFVCVYVWLERLAWDLLTLTSV